MNTQGHPWEEERKFYQGANTDLEGEVSANLPGKNYDAQNMRLTPINGNVGDLSKIGGERLEWAANVPGASTYICLSKYGQWNVAGHAVATWANTDTQYPPMMTIDGSVMIMSAALQWIASKPHQVRRAENCEDGVITITDGYSEPLVFSVQRIIEAFNLPSEEYFSEFNPDNYSVNLSDELDIPFFMGLRDVGPGGGVPPGKVSYSIRKVDIDGNRTNWGPDCPTISIPINIGTVNGYNNSPGMAGASLQGGAASDVGQPSRFGVVLRFRNNNLNNYARLELKRTRYAFGVPEVHVLAYAINTNGGINPWVEYVDTGEVLETLSDTEINYQGTFIESAGAVGYNDNRFALGDVVLATRDVQLTFREVGGLKSFPLTKRLGKAGHNDPFNNCYFKHNIGGERVRIGIQLYDSLGGKSFVVPFPDEIQHPNRRDEKSGDSLQASFDFDDGRCLAANVDNVVTPTFEVFDMLDAVSKSRNDDFVNIMIDGARNVNTAVPPFPSDTYIDQADQVVKTFGVKPLSPVRPTDISQFGHDYNVNTGAYSATDNGGVLTGYNPKGFEPNFHALGMALYGITNIPKWVSGFSIVRSKPAGRVIAQGLASYKLTTSTNAPAGKESYKVVVHFPDIESGLVSELDFNDFLANPSNFNLQAVSPLGFFTEALGGVSLQVNAHDSLSTDQISYARVLQDEGQINPFYSVHGIPGPGATDNFTGFSAWRNTIPANGPFTGGGNNGNSLLTIASVVRITTPAGSVHFEISVNEQLYVGGVPLSKDFTSQDTKDFHEPFYIVNLVKDGAHVDAALIDKWEHFGHFQKMKSTIGVSNGTASQEFALIAERIDDVMRPFGWFTLDYRYLYVDGKKWMCITNAPNIVVADIINDINNNGFWISPDGSEVYGIYETFLVSGGWNVRIGLYGINPPLDAYIEVRYDPIAPTKFFAGDATIGGAMSMPINNRCKTNAVNVAPANDNNNLDTPVLAIVTEGSNTTTNGTPLPMGGYRYNPRYYVPYGVFDDDNGGNTAVNQELGCAPTSIRQWGIYYDCETRTPLHLSAFIYNNRANQGYPHIHYVPRPAMFYASDTLTANGVFESYADVYGVNEKADWDIGGLRWARPANYDYAKLPKATSVSKPLFGYEEKLHRCNSVFYTPRVTTQLQNAPGYRTYPALNEFVLQSDSGDIQILYSDDDLFAVCDSGIARLSIGKSILNSGDGTLLGYTRQDAFIGHEKWVKGVGCPGNYWQMAADCFTYPGGDTKLKRNMLLFPSEEGWYKLIDHTPVEFTLGEYKSQLLPIINPNTFLFEGADEIPRCAGFDPDNNELWVSFGDGLRVPKTLCVYNTKVGAWQGKFTYRYDAFLHMNGKMRGMRDASTWRLGETPMDDINGEAIEAWYMRAISPSGGKKFELVRSRDRSRNKPFKVEFYDQDLVLVSTMSEAIFGPLYLKEHDGWENWVPCKNGNQRLQGNLFYKKVYFTARGADKAKSNAMEFKVLK